MELGQYKGLEVEKVSAEVTDEDVMKELEKVQKQNARKEMCIRDRCYGGGRSGCRLGGCGMFRLRCGCFCGENSCQRGNKENLQGNGH